MSNFKLSLTCPFPISISKQSSRWCSCKHHIAKIQQKVTSPTPIASLIFIYLPQKPETEVLSFCLSYFCPSSAVALQLPSDVFSLHVGRTNISNTGIGSLIPLGSPPLRLNFNIPAFLIQ